MKAKRDKKSGASRPSSSILELCPNGLLYCCLQKAYVEAVVWNADKTRKNKAKRDKKKAKKTKSGATSPTSQGPNSDRGHDSE
jgi:hypothetical protein